MRTYELLCLLKAGFDIENTDQIVTNIEKSITNLGGKILDCNKMGRKRLAYDIGKNRDSFCVSFKIDFDPEKLPELKRYFKLSDSVIRNFITTFKSKKPRSKLKAKAKLETEAVK